MTFRRQDIRTLLCDALHEMLEVGKRSRGRWRARGAHFARVQVVRGNQFTIELDGKTFLVEVRIPKTVPKPEEDKRG